MYTVSNIPKRGDVSEDVTTLQNALIEKGYHKVKADGVFGPQTKAAISEFQKLNGLPGSGIIGPITLKLLGISVKSGRTSTDGPSAITKDLKGRKRRFLHPTLRLLIESKVFPRGVIPDCFKNRNIQEMAVQIAIAMESMHIRETGGNNRGQSVGFIQSIIGPDVSNGTGDAWCMSTIQCIVAFIEDYLQVESPVYDGEGVRETFAKTKVIPGMLARPQEVGSICCARNGNKWTGHTWLVMSAVDSGKHTSFEGNTGADGGRDGDGAYFKLRNINKNGSLITEGFLRIYPNNEAP